MQDGYQTRPNNGIAVIIIQFQLAGLMTSKCYDYYRSGSDEVSILVENR